MRETFVKKLEDLAKDNPNIIILTADLGRFFKSFRDKYPRQFVNCGVAEENMVGIAAGLALSGKKVYCYSMIPFLIMKGLESIRVNICSQNLDVAFLGAGGGLVYGVEGMTHQSVEDLAIMRSFPNMKVVAPGDLLEVEALAKDSINSKGPLYVRFGKDKAPAVHQTLPDLKIGQGIVLRKGEGGGIALIAAGTLLAEAKKATEKLAEKGVSITLVSLPTIKPIDKELVKDLTESCQVIFTLEDHSVIGGLGSAILEVLNDLNFAGFFKRFALPDEYSQYVGRPDYLYKRYGLDADSLVQKILYEL